MRRVCVCVVGGAGRVWGVCRGVMWRVWCVSLVCDVVCGGVGVMDGMCVVVMVVVMMVGWCVVVRGVGVHCLAVCVGVGRVERKVLRV